MIKQKTARMIYYESEVKTVLQVMARLNYNLWQHS